VHGAPRPEKIALLPASDTMPGKCDGPVESANFLGGAILYRANLGYGRRMLPETANERNRPPRRGG
jgi:hypothetical protein